MSDQEHDGRSAYLWDRTGTPDPDVRRLERLLGRYGHRRPARRRRLLAAAAVLLAASVAVSFALTRTPGGPAAAWAVSWRQGAGTDRLHVGEWLETDRDSSARVEVADLGYVDVEPESRIRLLGTGPSEHRLQLERGRLHALVYAPPRLFVVDTAAATAVDLGCAYTLEVDAAGRGFLDVLSGHVRLEGRDGHDTYVPGGAMCRLSKRGPGLPYFRDAPAALRDLKPEDLDAALAAARPRDTLTLWHLLARVGEEARRHVVARIGALAQPPEDGEAVQRLDPEALLAWRRVLGRSW
jgi:hypothetical protein